MNKALTLEEIVESLVDVTNKVDTKLLNIFLYTYRAYCSPIDVLDLINNRLNKLASNDNTLGGNDEERDSFIKATIMFINAWLTMPFAYDFYEPEFKSLNHLLKLIRSWPFQYGFICHNNNFYESFRKLESKVSDILSNFSNLYATDFTGYRELAVDCQFNEDTSQNNQCLDLKCESIHRNFLEYTPEEIASCLTFIDQNLLHKLRLQELLMYVRRLSAPTVTAVITNYNHLHQLAKALVQSVQLCQMRSNQHAGQSPGSNPTYSGSQFLHPVHHANSCYNSHSSVGNSRSSSPNFSNFGSVAATSGSSSTSPSIGAVNDDSHLRNYVIDKWILIAKELYYLRNFSSLVAILTALNSSELKPFLRHFKKSKSYKQYNVYCNLLKIIEPTISQNKDDILNQNDSQTNRLLSTLNHMGLSKMKGKNRSQSNASPTMKRNGPEVPYLGVYLRHLTYVNEGFPDYNLCESDRVYTGTEHIPQARGHKAAPINLDKCRKQFDVLAQVRLCISSLSCNPVKAAVPGFMPWYESIVAATQTQQPEKNHSLSTSSTVSTSHSNVTTTGSRSPSISVDSLASNNSLDSNSGDLDLTFKIRREPAHYQSYECLRIDRRRLISSPPSNTPIQSTNGSIARVRIPSSGSFASGLNNFGDAGTSSGSVSLGANVKFVKVKLVFPAPNNTAMEPPPTVMYNSSRYPSNSRKPPLPGNAHTSNQICRSSSSAAADVKKQMANDSRADGKEAPLGLDIRKPSVSILTVNYKKIQMYENDHTSDFLTRVFKKFNKPNLKQSDFQVYQLLEKDNEIQLPTSSNIFYALAERPEYNIEIRRISKI